MALSNVPSAALTETPLGLESLAKRRSIVSLVFAISHFYLASRIFNSHLAFFMSHLAFLRRIYLQKVASRMSLTGFRTIPY